MLLQKADAVFSSPYWTYDGPRPSCRVVPKYLEQLHSKLGGDRMPGVHVAAHAIGNRWARIPTFGFGHDSIPLVQPNGQGRGPELGLQQLSVSAVHATNGEGMHGYLQCDDEHRDDLLPSYDR
jgi:hypothetical protein